MSTPALDVVGLRKTYARDGRTLEVLDLARLSVADGEFVTVVGPSGCGKSTLLHVLGGFIPGDAGEIRVHGRAVVGPGPDRGMVFQEFSLFPWRTSSMSVHTTPSVDPSRPSACRTRESVNSPNMDCSAVTLSSPHARLSRGELKVVHT